jgi:hypothetical protein
MLEPRMDARVPIDISARRVKDGANVLADALEEAAGRIFSAMLPDVPLTRSMKEAGAVALIYPVGDDAEKAARIVEIMLDHARPPCHARFLLECQRLRNSTALPLV